MLTLSQASSIVDHALANARAHDLGLTYRCPCACANLAMVCRNRVLPPKSSQEAELLGVDLCLGPRFKLETPGYDRLEVPTYGPWANHSVGATKPLTGRKWSRQTSHQRDGPGHNSR